MVLLACPECGKDVSDQALSCPNCGLPLREDPVLDYAERRIRIAYWVSWIMIGFGGVLGVVGLLTGELRQFTPLAIMFILFGIVVASKTLLSDYLITKSKIRAGKFSDRNK